MAKQYDVFISWTGADFELRVQIGEYLEKSGLSR